MLGRPVEKILGKKDRDLYKQGETLSP